MLETAPEATLKIVKTENSGFINYCPIISNIKTKSAVFIDPSWNETAFKGHLTESELDLKAILLTHQHLDHRHLAATLAKQYNCPVYISAHEADFYRFTCPNMIKIPPETNSLSIDGIGTFYILKTPGHTLGSICLWFQDWLFSGDTLFIEGCGICADEGSSPEMLYHSLKQLTTILPDSVRIYPAHRFNREIGQSFCDVKKHNIYLNIKNKEDFINMRMKNNKFDDSKFT